MQNENQSNIYRAIVEFQGEITNPRKDASNPFFKSKYATLDGMIDHCKPILKKHGLAVVQTFTPSEKSISLKTILLHEGGECIESILSIPVENDKPQTYGSAITYARRYAYAAILGITADDDDDGNASSQKTEQPKKQVALDYSVVPAGECRGQKWDDLTDDLLKVSAGYYEKKSDAVSKNYHTFIMTILQRRLAATIPDEYPEQF